MVSDYVDNEKERQNTWRQAGYQKQLRTSAQTNPGRTQRASEAVIVTAWALSLLSSYADRRIMNQCINRNKGGELKRAAAVLVIISLFIVGPSCPVSQHWEPTPRLARDLVLVID